MWVTQTYLGTVEPEASAFVYYFFEDYSEEQVSFTSSVQEQLEQLGEAFGDQVSLLMPNPRYAGRIEAEVRENRGLWEAVYEALPGLLVCSVPLARLGDDHDRAIFVPFKGENPRDVAAAIQEVRTAAALMIRQDFASRNVVRRHFGQRLLDAMELKPGLWGFRIDLRKLKRGNG